MLKHDDPRQIQYREAVEQRLNHVYRREWEWRIEPARVLGWLILGAIAWVVLGGFCFVVYRIAAWVARVWGL